MTQADPCRRGLRGVFLRAFKQAHRAMDSFTRRRRKLKLLVDSVQALCLPARRRDRWALAAPNARFDGRVSVSEDKGDSERANIAR